MASLIWEPVGFIGYTVKLRVKMSDGSSMSGNSDGNSFISAISNTSPYKPAFEEFWWSLGFGHQNYDYDDFWYPASTTYMGSVDTEYGDYFGSLGNGYGVVRIGHQEKLPYTFNVDRFNYQAHQKHGNYILASNWSWEVYGISAIVELPISTANSSSLGSLWGNTICAYNGVHAAGGASLPYFYDHVFGIGSWEHDELFGDAPFTNYVSQDSQDIPIGEIDNYNILISTVLHIANTSGGALLNIECAESDVIDASVELPGSADTRYAYAPAHFTSSIYNFAPTFLNISSPSYINEAESAPFEIEINPHNYRGVMQVYLLDSTSVDTVNEEIGYELEQFYGVIQDDVVAQYGTLEFIDSDNPHIKTIEVASSSVITIPVSYTASNVDLGQTDTFSVFVRANEFNYNAYSSDLYDAGYQWDLIPLQDKYLYTDNMRIDILDASEEHIEEYNPSDVLVTRPADIIHHLLSEELGFDKNKVDTVSKLLSREQNEGLSLAFSIHKEIEAKKLIKKISQSCKSIPTLSSDRLKFITIKDRYSGDEDISIIKSDDVIAYNFSRTKIENVKTQVNIKYKKDYGLKSYLESTGEIKVDESTYFLTGSYGDMGNMEFSNYYGVKSAGSTIDHVDTFLDIKSDYIRDNSAATSLGYRLLQWHKNQHNIVSLKLGLKYYGFEVGDLIEFDKMMEGRKLYGEKYVIEAPEDMPIRCGQYVLPLFMITETNKSLDSISIKAVQLHHMSGLSLNYRGVSYSEVISDTVASEFELIVPEAPLGAGSGDVNNDGFTNVMDVVIMVNYVIGNIDFTSEQIESGDVNGDGFVDILDVVAIINYIVEGVPLGDG